MRRLLIAMLLAGAAATPALAVPDNWHSNRPQRDDNAQSDSRSERHQSDNGSSHSQSENGSSRGNSSGSRAGHEDSNGGSNQGVPMGGNRNDFSNGGGHHDSSSGSDNNGGMSWRGHGSFSGGQQDNGGNRNGWEGRVVDTRTGDTGQQGNGGNHSGWRREVTSDSGTSDAGTSQGSGDRRDFWQRRTRVISSGSQAAPGGLVQPERPVPRVFRGRTPVISDTPREGTQPPLRTEGRRTTSHVAWNHNWRHDRRYDWWNWRRTHRSHFHLGFYYDPFGWGYSPFSIGWRMWPSYYSSRYWINDPWELRLPYAPPGYRWIRYYDDAILIDTWDGQVVDVIYNFFW